ncbi:putative Ubiquitin-like domain-containing protein [Helianthus annuus]|uniref:Putative ubiquitin n=1 Tax=Helianthus annuus TaxID=4232 RepID=A0A251VSN3_HELAN|nr:putative Ubiquitin domain-containing protein [Helianthus annuus]KAJ0628168.1 putative Ubiquitin-like domain-containing protein [Helianthus annuus]KAJ0784456.1 putative Ubiquitin-like domain-containing protein [Helianthus annuus]KAJ0949508.1 putative Ubiquitin-like domain-containing protein [Helianthus annuus]
MTITGKTISLQVKELDTIRTIKLQTEAKEGIPCRQQELILNEMLLQDTVTIGDLRIEKGSTLKLLRNSKMSIFVQTPGPYHLIFPLEVKLSDTIGNVKAKLLSQYGYGNVLIFNEMVLDEDNDTLADFNITNGSTLTCIDTIMKVKSKIERMEGIPVDEQVLIFNKVVLEDSGTVLNLQIKEKSTLTLLQRSRGFMKIFIKTLTRD